VHQIGNQIVCTIVVHNRHAFIRATSRPMVRSETPKMVAHSAWLLPRRSRARKQGTAEQ